MKKSIFSKILAFLGMGFLNSKINEPQKESNFNYGNPPKFYGQNIVKRGTHKKTNK